MRAFSGRCCTHLFVIYMLLALTGILAARAEVDNAVQFKAACMPKCAAHGHAEAFCDKYCDCNVSEFQRKFGDKMFSRQPAGADGPSAEEILGVAATCNGRYVENYFDAVVARQCGSDAGCARVNRCVAGELRAVGPDTEIGAILLAVILKNATGGGDAQKLKRYEEMGYICQGRDAIQNMQGNCMKECGSDAECDKSCACFAGKVKGVGGETQIGEMITLVARGDAGAKKQYSALAAECGLSIPE